MKKSSTDIIDKAYNLGTSKVDNSSTSILDINKANEMMKLIEKLWKLKQLGQ